MFEKFINEKRWLSNVSPATIEWYKTSLAWLPSENPNESDLKNIVIRMREKGLRPAGCNSRICAINSYLHWAHSANWATGVQGTCRPHCTHPKLKTLKEPQNVVTTFTVDQIKRLIGWKPKGFFKRRLHLLILILLDTGCRIDEVLSLRTADIDLNDLLMLVNGKGSKQRRIPFSVELRRALYKYISDYERRPEALLLASKRESKLGRRDVLRDVKNLCRHLGFEPPARTIHCFRHTAAVNYLRRGGSVFHLQKQLGHSTLDMTRRYANLLTEDLQAVHNRVSLLSTLRG